MLALLVHCLLVLCVRVFDYVCVCVHKKKQRRVMGEALGAGRTKNKQMKVVLFNWLLLRRSILTHQSGAERG